MKPQRRPAVPFAQLVRSVLFRTKVVDSTVGMFIGLIGVAMALYRGGTWWDPLRERHSFWENFLCDLLHRQTLGGHPNLVGSRLALGGMLALVVSLVAAFSLAPEIVPSRRPLGRFLAKFGMVGSLCIAASPLLPSDAHPLLHTLSVVFGGLPALVAFSILVGAILLEPAAPRPLRAVSLGVLVLVVVAMALYTWSALLHGPSWRLLPAIERLANLGLLAWLILVAQWVRQRLIEAFKVLVKRSVATGVHAQQQPKDN